MLVAVTGDDEDNLVSCQVAKHKYNVPRTVARIRNPQNADFFRKLGVDVTVSATEKATRRRTRGLTKSIHPSKQNCGSDKDDAVRGEFGSNLSNSKILQMFLPELRQLIDRVTEGRSQDFLDTVGRPLAPKLRLNPNKHSAGFQKALLLAEGFRLLPISRSLPGQGILWALQDNRSPQEGHPIGLNHGPGGGISNGELIQ